MDFKPWLFTCIASFWHLKLICRFNDVELKCHHAINRVSCDVFGVYRPSFFPTMMYHYVEAYLT